MVIKNARRMKCLSMFRKIAKDYNGTTTGNNMDYKQNCVVDILFLGYSE